MPFILLLCLFFVSSATIASTDIEFGPINRAPDEAIAGFSAKHLEQFEERAPVLFSQFMAGISSQFDKESQYHTDVASAQFYFNDLYANGSVATRKCLTALTTKLNKLMGKEYWSTERKALLIHAFLQSSFNELLKTLHTKQDKEKAQKLSRHLIISITPTLLGVGDKIKRLPWKRIILLSALAGGGLYAYKNNLWQHFKNNTANTFKILAHVNNSVAENQRIKEAFEETIEKDAKGKMRMKHDHTLGRPVYLIKEQYRTLPDRTQEQWILAPEGFGDRALRLGESLKPLAARIVEKLSDNANEQQAWFIAHKIPTDSPHEHFKLVATDSGGYEMRYVSSVTVPEHQIPADPARLIPFMTKNKLWKDKATGQLHPTFLPPRNLMEQAITTAGGLVSALQDKTIKDFVTILSDEFKRNRQDALNWLKSEELVAPTETDPTKLLRGVSVHWDKKDYRIYYRKTDPVTGAATADHIYPPASVVDKLFLGISSLTEKGTASEELLRSIAGALAENQRTTREWLFNEGLSLSPEDPSLKPGVGHEQDDHHVEFYLRDKTKGHDAMVNGKKNKVYPLMSSAAHLFVTLSKISREGGIPLETLMKFTKQELEGVKDWGDGALGQLKYDLLSPAQSKATELGAVQYRTRRLRKLIEKAEAQRGRSAEEAATIQRAKRAMEEALNTLNPKLLNEPTAQVARMIAVEA